jgi:hypothetical protein
MAATIGAAAGSGTVVVALDSAALSASLAAVPPAGSV